MFLNHAKSSSFCADPRRALSARRRRHQDYTGLNSVAAAVQRAAQDRILDLRCCGLHNLPDIPQDKRLTQARVLDARYNSIKTAAPAADMEGLVILNLAHNKLKKLSDTAGKYDTSSLCVCALPRWHWQGTSLICSLLFFLGVSGCSSSLNVPIAQVTNTSMIDPKCMCVRLIDSISM